MSRNPVPLESLLLPLKPESLQCLHRFVQYERRKEVRRYPRKRCAAVAVVLFVGRLGDLYVLLSTRSGNMRSYASDTALPGGKYEEGDENEEGTARREAFEEIGLPMDKEQVRLLCLLDPFLTGNGLIVTPVILLVTDNAINPVLNPDEVSHLFSMPLPSFLYSDPRNVPGWHFGISTSPKIDITISDEPPPPVPPYAEDREEEEGGKIGGREGRYYMFRDIKWGEGSVRMHRFLTGREGGGVKPVYGLTSAILIMAARIGYDQEPDFQVLAPGQQPMQCRIEWEIRYGAGPLRRAVEHEGLWEDWKQEKSKL